MELILLIAYFFPGVCLALWLTRSIRRDWSLGILVFTMGFWPLILLVGAVDGACNLYSRALARGAAGRQDEREAATHLGLSAADAPGFAAQVGQESPAIRHQGIGPY